MDRSEITLERMRTFVRVAERANLSAVARELGIGQSTVTRHLRELEEALGVPLLSRTTRRVTMTDEGGRYYAHCVQILRLVDQASEEARGARGAFRHRHPHVVARSRQPAQEPHRRHCRRRQSRKLRHAIAISSLPPG